MSQTSLPKSIEACLRPPADVALIEHLAKDLNEAMRRLHGGEWRYVVDHATGFVLVRPS